jgi:hypothetical protein
MAAALIQNQDAVFAQNAAALGAHACACACAPACQRARAVPRGHTDHIELCEHLCVECKQDCAIESFGDGSCCCMNEECGRVGPCPDFAYVSPLTKECKHACYKCGFGAVIASRIEFPNEAPTCLLCGANDTCRVMHGKTREEQEQTCLDYHAEAELQKVFGDSARPEPIGVCGANDCEGVIYAYPLDGPVAGDARVRAFCPRCGLQVSAEGKAALAAAAAAAAVAVEEEQQPQPQPQPLAPAAVEEEQQPQPLAAAPAPAAAPPVRQSAQSPQASAADIANHRISGCPRKQRDPRRGCVARPGLWRRPVCRGSRL